MTVKKRRESRGRLIAALVAVDSSTAKYNLPLKGRFYLQSLRRSSIRTKLILSLNIIDL